jgi:hypothetical protein
VTDRQVPTEPATLQAVQAPAHAVLQHTPWAQCRELHSALPLHEFPTALSPHEPFTQRNPLAHCALLEQVATHLVPVQVKGLQLRAAGVAHCPAAVQVAAGV